MRKKERERKRGREGNQDEGSEQSRPSEKRERWFAPANCARQLGALAFLFFGRLRVSLLRLVPSICGQSQCAKVGAKERDTLGLFFVDSYERERKGGRQKRTRQTKKNMGEMGGAAKAKL